MGPAAVLVALALAFPLGASAGPMWARIPPGTVWADMPAGMVCPVAVGEVVWTYLDGNQSIVDRPGGRLMTNMGTSQFEVRSVLTGKSVVLHLSGQATYSPPAEDGSFVIHTAGTGAWGLWPGDAGPGDRTTGRSFMFVGTTTALLAADGTGLEFSYSGQIVMDICAAIS
jgi:hypothetical protein